MVWQDISTAPKGVWILGRKAGWTDGSVNAPCFVGKLYDLRADALIDPSKGRWVVCTHWMPLPEAPSSPDSRA